MTVEEVEALFDKFNEEDEYLEFERIENPRGSGIFRSLQSWWWQPSHLAEGTNGP
jgi:hypothetical protein